MFKILEKHTLAPKVDMMVIHAPYIAKHAKTGNFVILRLNEKGERIPLTIADSDGKSGTITILYQKVGKTTEALGLLKPGNKIRDVVGPLGHEMQIKTYGRCILVAGGMGAATLYPILKALKETNPLSSTTKENEINPPLPPFSKGRMGGLSVEMNNHVTVIMGARTKELLIWEDKFRQFADECLITTDDGTYGRKGLVTDVLKEVIEAKSAAIIIAVGPIRMMKAVSDLTKPYGIKTIVSLNSLMVEGTGMCGACRVRISGETKFACIDGPEFDGHEVDFQEL
ncbi:MAG: sulfide/dihydroorotate dehydrogenase-like FAD/NAD-binding protein, partial [Nitrospirota bacterium]